MGQKIPGADSTNYTKGEDAEMWVDHKLYTATVV